MWEVIIHFAFLISAIAMAYTDKILYSTSHKTINTQSAVKLTALLFLELILVFKFQ